MRLRYFFPLLFCLLAMSALGQPQPTVLILPIEMPEYYNPVDSEALTKALETDIQKMAPQAKLVLARPADLTAYGYKAGGEQPPTQQMADKLCRAYGVGDVAWISLRFKPDFNPQTGALALAGAVRFWDYHADSRRIAFDQSLSLVRVGQVNTPDDEAEVQTEVRKLAAGCIGDLAYQLVGLARQRSVKPPASAANWKAPADDPIKSRNYRAMIRATVDYQRAVKNSSFVDITSSQAAMTKAWTVLNQAERDAIAASYPDLKEAMTQVPVYEYGGYYTYPWVRY